MEATNLPNFIFSIKLKYLKLAYHHLISNALYIFLLLVLFHLSSLTAQDFVLYRKTLNFNFLTPIYFSALCALYFLARPRKIYLVDFSCYKAEPSQKCSKQLFMHLSAQTRHFSDESLEFQKKILEKSGYGQMTYIPKSFLQVPPDKSISAARAETEAVIFGAIDDLLAKTGVKIKEIGILVVNISVFNPTPSLSATIVNRYKLRENILSYNLGGMGCSAGIISIDLAKDLLKVHPKSYALIVSTENITTNWYFGNERSMLISNCLFRVGGAAILLSNHSSDKHRSKYELIHTIRTHKGADNKSFECIGHVEDETKKSGISLSKNLMAIAGDALKANIRSLGPLVLPLSEQMVFFVNLLAKNLFKMKIKSYTPDFKLAFEHFCVHAGGRGVLDEIEKSLKLTMWDMEPSRMTLYRFGNTSSSSLWYELAYSEAKGRIKRGDRIWQLGFGSGFKANSAVWRALRTVNPSVEKNPWTDEIDQFPVFVPIVDHFDY
ncbi:hypothetical protein ACFE04_012305 [Oxalis oulophora]